MEGFRLLLIGFSIYAILYCAYAVKVVLVYREIQLERFNEMKQDAYRLNELYIIPADKYNIELIKNPSINQIIAQIRTLKQKPSI